MDYSQAIEAIEGFSGRAVCVDTIIVRPGPGAQAGACRDEVPGVLRRQHPSEFEEFWWTLAEAAYFECATNRSFMVARRSFRGAEWDGDTLLVDLGAMIYRIVPAVRS